MIHVDVRWLIRKDLTQVLEIDAACSKEPWTETEFLVALKKRNCIGMVAIDDCDIIRGFMLYELHKERLHVLAFAVDPAYQRQGVGMQMVEKLVGKLSAQRRTEIRVEVRETNLAAQLFFRSQGFLCTEILHGYFEDEDAYVMSYRIREEMPVAVATGSRNRISGVFKD